ncbi:hypothetical protein [Hydrogenophaga sp. OTU3427]|uniref:hypothetical protein n=1 Tax=Hydrogenophaga sp. OTU3427 TaxID=3043856 RepID=UPI00313DDCBF
MRRITISALLLSACAATGTLAQSAPATTTAPQGVEQKTERIQHKDAGSQIDELRVGGETRRIDVSTQTDVPAYQVAPQSANEAPASGGQRTGSAGRTSWRMFNF